MVWDDGNRLFGMGSECPEHGDEKMRECRMCGMDFCAGCFPGSAVCPQCADEAEDEDYAEEEDAALMKEIGDLIGEDELEEDLSEDLDALGPDDDLDPADLDDDVDDAGLEDDPDLREDD